MWVGRGMGIHVYTHGWVEGKVWMDGLREGCVWLD